MRKERIVIDDYVNFNFSDLEGKSPKEISDYFLRCQKESEDLFLKDVIFDVEYNYDEIYIHLKAFEPSFDEKGKFQKLVQEKKDRQVFEELKRKYPSWT